MFYASSWRATRRGRVLVGTWVILLTGLTARAVNRLRKRRRQQRQSDAASSTAAPPTPSPFKRVLRAACSGTGTVRLNVALLSAAVVLRLWSAMRLSRQVGVLGATLASRSWDKLTAAQVAFALAAIPTAGFTAVTAYAERRLAAALRTGVTEHVVDAYASAGPGRASTALSSTFSSLPRTVEDLGAAMAALYVSVYRPVVEVVLLSAKLSVMMGPGNLLRCYGALGALGSWARWVAPSPPTAGVVDAEAELQDGHSRAVEFREELERDGRPDHAAVLRRLFRRAQAAGGVVDRGHAAVSTVQTYVVRHLGTLAAFATMVPAITADASVDATEYCLTCLHLLVNVGMACGQLMTGFAKRATCNTLASRVVALVDELAAPPAATPATVTTASGFTATDLTVRRGGDPAGAVLLSGLSFAVAPGSSTLLRGPNGCGKSSLLKCLAGVWQPAGGTLGRPLPDCVLYLPQRPYINPYGSFREQLAFGGGSLPCDKDFLGVSALCGLSVLVASAGGPDADATSQLWRGLSQGERQRVAIARLLLRCRPGMFVLLDEPTAAVPEAFAVQLFQRLAGLGVTCITASHRSCVEGLHSQVIDLAPA